MCILELLVHLLHRDPSTRLLSPQPPAHLFNESATQHKRRSLILVSQHFVLRHDQGQALLALLERRLRGDCPHLCLVAPHRELLALLGKRR